MNKIELAKTFCCGSRISLRPLHLKDVGKHYCRWLNDPETTRFLECRFQQHTLASLRRYVASTASNDSIHFMAMIQVADNRHIGNIKLGPVDERHFLADVGILIGEADCRGKSYGVEALRLISRYAFEGLGLHKLTAGAYASNVASRKAFTKAGFTFEGIRKEQYLLDGRFEDACLFGLINPAFSIPASL